MNLQAYLDRNDLSRADFAKQIGVSEVAVTRYIGGKRMPRPEVLSKIREATNGAVTPNDFLPEQEAGAPRPFRPEGPLDELQGDVGPSRAGEASLEPHGVGSAFNQTEITAAAE
jgi:transcriptional regulator with XRE-family HTH domain